MQKGILLATTLLFISFPSYAAFNPACKMSYDEAESAAKQNLLERYPDSYSTVKMLLDSNMRDYQKLCGLPDTEPHHGILQKLNSRYAPSWSTIWMLYESNIKAYNELR